MMGHKAKHPSKKAFNVLQVVALNVILSVSLFAVLSLSGTGMLAALLWSWIGGSVLTLWGCVLLLAYVEAQAKPMRKTRADMIAEWDEDALDAAWQDRIGNHRHRQTSQARYGAAKH